MHQQGVIHHDIKPDNIALVSTCPTKVVIIDLGHSEVTHRSNNRTSSRHLYTLSSVPNPSKPHSTLTHTAQITSAQSAISPPKSCGQNTTIRANPSPSASTCGLLESHCSNFSSRGESRLSWDLSDTALSWMGTSVDEAKMLAATILLGCGRLRGGCWTGSLGPAFLRGRWKGRFRRDSRIRGGGWSKSWSWS